MSDAAPIHDVAALNPAQFRGEYSGAGHTLNEHDPTGRESASQEVGAADR